MDIAGSIIAFCKALPGIMNMIIEFGAMVKEKQLDAWFQDAADTFKAVRTAQTQDEKLAAAKRLSDLIHRV